MTLVAPDARAYARSRFFCAACSRNVRISSAKRSGSHPDGGGSDSFFRRNADSSPRAERPSPGPSADASCGIVCVCRCAAFSSVRRCAIRSSSSRGESSALISSTSGTAVRIASTAASSESTAVTSAPTFSRTIRLRMAAWRRSGSIASTSGDGLGVGVGTRS